MDEDNAQLARLKLKIIQKLRNTEIKASTEISLVMIKASINYETHNFNIVIY